jgi:uncharacterized damage-inducible protein DinB
MRLTTLLFLMLVVTSASMAQKSNPQGLTSEPRQTDSALTAETRHVFQAISANTAKAAREMPESAYGFKPTNDARTFGDLVAHIADVQTTLCANINDHHPAKTEGKASKDSIIKALASSAVECAASFDELSAENESKLVQAPAGQVTHLAALIYIITHASEEYGQMSIYLRLNHLTPPTSDEVKGGSAGKAKAEVKK